MNIRPSDYFHEQSSGHPPWKICMEIIGGYIRDLDVPVELFEGGEKIPQVERFHYFTRIMNGNFDLRFRRRNCHPPLFALLQEHGIQDEEVLWWYVWEFLGYKIPRIPVCQLHNPDHDKFDYKHVAPFDYVKDMFFEIVRDTIAFANRTGGKTSNVAILNHLDMAFKSGCEVASAGATLDQASKVYRYFTRFHKHPLLEDLLERPSTKTMTIYNNGSIQEVVTGSVKGLNSPHPQKARIDEVELMEWDVLQEGFSMSMSKGDIKGQITLLCVTKDMELWPSDPCLYLDIEKRIGPLNESNWQEHQRYRVEDLLILYEDPQRKKKALLFVFDEKTKKWDTDAVKRVWRTKRDKVYEIKYKAKFDGEDYVYCSSRSLTIDHLVLMEDYSWKEVGQLKVGDHLRFGGYWKSPDYAEFLGAECKGKEDVYDIEMENHHNFVAGHGIILHNSTRKYDTGTFNRLLEESDVKGMRVYCWCIYEVLERCTRKCQDDPEHGDCPILDKCGGVAHHCDGFYPLDDWIGKARILSREVLDTQWFNKKPSKDILVYGAQWKPEVHYRKLSELEISPDRIVMGAIDFGSSPGHDFVYQKMWVDYSDLFRSLEELEPGKELYYKLRFFVFYEYRAGKGTLAYHAAKIKASPEYKEGEVIFADPSAKQARIDLLETYRIDTYMAVNEVVDGIDSVRNHLEAYRDYADGGREKSYYYIVEGYLDKVEDEGRDDERTARLLGTHEEFERYKYPKQQDGKVIRKIPIPMYDHGLDCTRYAIHTSYRIIMDLVVPAEDSIVGGYWDQGR